MSGWPPSRVIWSAYPLGFLVLFLSLISLSTFPVEASPNKKGSLRSKSSIQKTSSTQAKRQAHQASPTQFDSDSVYRGWDWLVGRLLAKGVARADLISIYANPKFPPFTFVPFSPDPKESSGMYTGFLKAPMYELARDFMSGHSRQFDLIERTLKVPREVVTAILLIETQFGRNTGDHIVLYRLSRIATTGEPGNIDKNLKRLKPEMPNLTRETLVRRAKYLEDVFLPEIPALIEIGKRNHIDPLNVKGSIAGAFGLPQFLPSAFLRFGVDGDKNGFVSLFSEVDAIWSAANYLSSYGYREDLSLADKRAVIWKYNKSDAYIDTVLAVARAIQE